MININNYIVEKLSINKDTKFINHRSEDEIRKDSIEFIKKFLKDNTEYKNEGDDYEISLKNDDYIFLVIYSADKKELEKIGDDITVELKKEGLMGEYEWYEMGSSNKSWCNKKLIFRVNIEHIISRDDFRNVTFKRTKRF